MFPSDCYHPLSWAFKYSVDCLRILLIEFHGDPQWKTAAGLTLIHYAGQCGYTVSLLLLTRHASSNLVFVLAVSDNVVAIVCLHNEFGVSLDSVTSGGRAPLHLAVINNRLSAVRLVCSPLEP